MFVLIGSFDNLLNVLQVYYVVVLLVLWYYCLLLIILWIVLWFMVGVERSIIGIEWFIYYSCIMYCIMYVLQSFQQLQ